MVSINLTTEDMDGELTTGLVTSGLMPPALTVAGPCPRRPITLELVGEGSHSAGLPRLP